MDDDDWPPEPEYPDRKPWIQAAMNKVAFDAQSLQVWGVQLKRKELWAPYPKPGFFDYFARLEAVASVTRRLVEWLYFEPSNRYADHLRAEMLLDTAEAKVAWSAFADGERKARARAAFDSLSEEAAHFTRSEFDPHDRLWEHVAFVREGLNRFGQLSRSGNLFSPEAMQKLGYSETFRPERKPG
jgi:hypothetical protein